MDTEKKEKRVVKKTVEKDSLINREIQKAVVNLIQSIKLCELTFDTHLKQPAILDGLINKHFKPVLLGELEKRRL